MPLRCLDFFSLFAPKMTQIVEEEKSISGREHPRHGMVVVGYGRGQFLRRYSLMRGSPGQERLGDGRFPRYSDDAGSQSVERSVSTSATKCPYRPQCPCLASYATMGSVQEGRLGRSPGNPSHINISTGGIPLVPCCRLE